MPLHLHRSNRAERLVGVLCERLLDGCSDPFQPVPIVVGSRGMERWLRHQVASARGVAAQLAFPFPSPALDGAVAALLGTASGSGAFWERPESDMPWSQERLLWRVAMALRARLMRRENPEFAAFSQVERFLGGTLDPSSPLQARELAFAAEVAQTIDNVIRQRPDLARRWLRAESLRELHREQRWLAALLRDLVGPEQEGMKAHPASAREELARRLDVGLALRPLRATMHVFGLSTLPREELRALALVSQAPDLVVHLYTLAPSAHWFADHDTRGEVATELRRLRARAGTGELNEAQLAHAQREVIDRRERTNPLLADLGRPSRDVQALLETWAQHYREADVGDEALGLFVDPAVDPTPSSSALRLLQRDLLHAQPLPSTLTETEALRPDDSSLSFHACYGPLRQVEALRDELLRAFADDPSLTPRDVLVMTPDIATYAPLVAAVFAAKGEGAPRPDRHGGMVQQLPSIPVTIADLGLRATNPVADVLLRVLELAGKRVTLPALLDLLHLAPLQRRFGLSAEDVGHAQRLLTEAGARWGLDADDRQRAGQPALHQNTFAFATERLALGALFLDEDDLQPHAVRRSAAIPHGIDASSDFVPFSAQDGEDLDRFGRLSACVAAVLHHRDVVSAPASIPQWGRRLRALLDELTATSDASSWLTGRVVAELDDLAAAAADADEQAVTKDAMLQLLQGRFDVRRRGDRPITGAVTMCAMEPMRSVPFRVVALLGMDDRAFPRQPLRRGWDPLRHERRAGEHDRRDIDRHLLLEAILSARDRLVVLWSGYTLDRGDSLPPAVPISELLEVAVSRLSQGPGAPPADAVRAQLLRYGALQPWSEAALQGPNRRRTFDAAMLQGAEALRNARDGSVPALPSSVSTGRVGAVLRDQESDAGDEVRALQAAALADDLVNPSRALLRDRFGLRLADDTAEVADREPLSNNALHLYQVRESTVALGLAGRSAEAAAVLTRRWRAEGKLAIGPPAEHILMGQVDEGVALVREALAAVGLGGGETVATALALRDLLASVDLDDGTTWSITASGVHVAPSPHGGRKDALIFPFTGRLDARRLLLPWIALLVGAAGQTQRPVAGAVVVGRLKRNEVQTLWLAAPTPAQATRKLQALLLMRRTARLRPVPLFKRTSYQLAERLHDLGWPRWADLTPTLRRALRDNARDNWAPDNGFGGDGQDRWVAALHGTPDFDAALPEPARAGVADPPWVQAARKVWAPMLKAAAPLTVATQQLLPVFSADPQPRGDA